MELEFHADSLIEARLILEVAAVRMAAERRTKEDIREINIAQGAFRDQILDQGHAVEEDLLFHLEVISAGKNNTLKSLYMKIFSNLFYLLNETNERDSKKNFIAIPEHENIIEHITDQNQAAAAKAMRLHLK